MGGQVFTRGPCGPHARRLHRRKGQERGRDAVANQPREVRATRHHWHRIHRFWQVFLKTTEPQTSTDTEVGERSVMQMWDVLGDPNRGAR